MKNCTVKITSILFLVTILFSSQLIAGSVPQLEEQTFFSVPTAPVKMAYSPTYKLLAVMASGQIYIYNALNGTIVSQKAVTASNQFTDLDITPSGRFLFVADYGSEQTGYGTPIRPHYVHRYDLSQNTWETGTAPKIAWKLEAVSDDIVILQEQDQWIDLTLNRFAPIMTELHRVGCDYYGDIEYDPSTKRIYHGNSNSSSNEIHVYSVQGETINSQGGTGVYGSAQSGGGTSTLATDGSVFYYGKLQVEALDVTNNLHTFAEPIYAASPEVAFGTAHYYDSSTATALGSLGYSTTKYAIGADGQDIWAYNSTTGKVHHYYINTGQSTTMLESLEISGIGVVPENTSTAYRAIAVYSDGSRVDVTTTSSWSLSNTDFAIINAEGMLTTGSTLSTGSFSVEASYSEGAIVVDANKTVEYKPSLSSHQLSEIESFPAGGQAVQIEYSSQFGILFLRNSGSAIRVINTKTQSELELHMANATFTDMDLTPDERFLFVADYGGTNTGYGTPTNPHYVHRYDLSDGTWEILEAPQIAWKVEAVSSNRVLLQEEDQHVDMTLNSFENNQMQELSRIRADYYGDFEYDFRTSRVYHGNSGSSSHEIHVRKVVGDTLINCGDSGTYGTADQGGGTSVLNSDGKYFYYGRLQVEALDITNNLHYFPELIYAGSEAIAFGENYYYDAFEGDPLGSLGFACKVYFITNDGKHLWAFEDEGDILHHYQIGIPSATVQLEGIEILGPSSVCRKMTVPYTALATYSDGSIDNVTLSTEWGLSSGAYGTIDAEGALKTFGYNQPTSFEITASYTESGVTVSATKHISYIPRYVTYYIDAENGNDDNDGVTPQTAFATIMKGVREAFDGDSIKLNPGTYNETINYLGKAISIGSTADAAVLNGNSSQEPLRTGTYLTMNMSTASFGGVVFENEENHNSILENVVIRNYYTGIYCGNASPTIRNVTVVNNAVGIIAWDNAVPTISNSILWYNSQSDLQGAQATYSCIQHMATGQGNISNNPIFVDPASDNYHLQSRMGHYAADSNGWVLDAQSSPCIDKGNPGNSPLQELEPNGGLINMGAYGGTAFASKSPGQWPNDADINHDGIVNFKDLAILSQNWLWEALWY